jgi:coenzyme F420-reducing hydrogenase gamma subunit
VQKILGAVSPSRELVTAVKYLLSNREPVDSGSILSIHELRLRPTLTADRRPETEEQRVVTEVREAQYSCTGIATSSACPSQLADFPIRNDTRVSATVQCWTPFVVLSSD